MYVYQLNGSALDLRKRNNNDVILPLRNIRAPRGAIFAPLQLSSPILNYVFTAGTAQIPYGMAAGQIPYIHHNLAKTPTP
ncbi:hypothetical protein M8494_12805 [Serratia ureilytica]